MEIFNESSCRTFNNKDSIFGSEYIDTGYVNPVDEVMFFFCFYTQQQGLVRQKYFRLFSYV